MHNESPFAVRGPYNVPPPHPSPKTSIVEEEPTAIAVWEKRICEALRRTQGGLDSLEKRLSPALRDTDLPAKEHNPESQECDLHRVFAQLLSLVEDNNHLLSRIHQNLCL